MKGALGILVALSLCCAQETKKHHGIWLNPDKSEPAGARYQTFSSRLAGSEVSYRLSAA
jgi:hypothetical protein